MSNIDKYILTIYENKSITQAAKKLNISQPALSSSLTSHEKKLGYAIFNRSSSFFTTTQEGLLYINYLYKKKILESELNTQIANIHGDDNIYLSIGAPAMYAYSYILPILPNFIFQHPQCKLKILEGTVSQLSELCKNGEIDLFISTHNNDSFCFDYHHFVNEQLFLYIPRKIAEESNIATVFDIPKLCNTHFIFLGQSQPLQQIISTFFEDINFKPSKVIEVDQIASAIKLAENGCGICFAPNKSIITPQNDKLVALPLPSAKYNRNIYFATSKNRILSDLHTQLLSSIINNNN